MPKVSENGERTRVARVMLRDPHHREFTADTLNAYLRLREYTAKLVANRPDLREEIPGVYHGNLRRRDVKRLNDLIEELGGADDDD